jgi:hypothetical protein
MSIKYPPSRFTIGTVVLKQAGFSGQDEKLGHVTGFSRNTFGEAIIEVRWEDGETHVIHPSQVIVEPDEWPKTWSQDKCVRAQKTREEEREQSARQTKDPSFLLRLFALRG